MLHPLARFFLILVDIIAMMIAFVVSVYIARYISENWLGNIYSPLWRGEATNRFFAFAALALAGVFLLYNRGHYTYRTPWWNQVRYVLLVLLGILCVDGFIHFALKYPFSRLWIACSWLCSIAFILMGRWVARGLARVFKVWNVPTIVIGDIENGMETLFALHSEHFTGYDVRGMVLYRGYEKFSREMLPKNYNKLNVWHGVENYTRIIRRYPDAMFILAPDTMKGFPLEKLINLIIREEHAYVVVPPVEGVPLYGARPQYFFGHDVMFLWPRSRIYSPLGRLIKRAVDVVGSLCGLMLLSPVFLVLCLAVQMQGGRIFFKHHRVGKKGKEFGCWKFRTMRPDAQKILEELLASDPKAKEEWERDFKLRNDPRITPIGKFLRKSSLDELPQLWNVLKGDMSLVGPRPIVKEEKQYYGERLAAYISVRPGVTGLWQVSGRNDTGYPHRVRLDEWYVRNWSLWYDIVILFKTIRVVLGRSNAGAY